MGAPRLHPREGGTVVDGEWLAKEYGKTNSDIYAMARTGQFGCPQPIGAPDVFNVNPQNWRWARSEVLAWLKGEAA